jgi:hypothetical protein
MTHTLRSLLVTGFVTGLSLLSPLPQCAQAQAIDDGGAADEAVALEEIRAQETARAVADYAAERDRAESEREDDDVYARFELTMGFVGGYASYADLGFSGAPSLPPSAFSEGPVSGTPMAGLRYDVRLVVAFLRMTVGGDFMWGLFDASSTRTMEDGTMVSDRRVFDAALRFGLGLEANIDGIRLFADVLGAVHFVEAEIAQQDVASTHRAVAFAPGLRLGVRIPVVPHFFVQVSADGSPFGPGFIGGDLSVGGAIE